MLRNMLLTLQKIVHCSVKLIHNFTEFKKKYTFLLTANCWCKIVAAEQIFGAKCFAVYILQKASEDSKI